MKLFSLTPLKLCEHSTSLLPNCAQRDMFYLCAGFLFLWRDAGWRDFCRTKKWATRNIWLSRDSVIRNYQYLPLLFSYTHHFIVQMLQMKWNGIDQTLMIRFLALTISLFYCLKHLSFPATGTIIRMLLKHDVISPSGTSNQAYIWLVPVWAYSLCTPCTRAAGYIP